MALLSREKALHQLKSSLVLIVDDLEFNQLILEEILVSSGFHNTIKAANGKEAFELTKEKNPDIVLLDLQMPVMDGFEYCREVRSILRFRDMPILVQTALSIPEERIKAFDVGATDFVNKPVDADEIVARVLVHLERQQLTKELRESQRRMQEELHDARQMQQVLMPSVDVINTISKRYGVDVYSFLRSSSELGGDFWGVDGVEDNKLAFYITDFSGHGVTAALNTFRLHAVMTEFKHITDPGEFLTELNARITPLLAVDQFATMMYFMLDVDKGELFYSAAGSTNPFIYSHRRKDVINIDGSGLPLGVEKNYCYETSSIPFEKGDWVLLYSDALIETHSNKDGFYTESMILEDLNKTVAGSAEASGRAVFEALLEKFQRNYMDNLRDDLTITLFSRKS